MLTPSTIATFALASIAILIIPGPAVLYILNRSVSDGRRVGLAAVAGIELGTRRPSTPTVQASAHAAPSTKGSMVNMLNPKVALFFLSFLPQFIHPDRGHPTAQAFLLGLEFVVIACFSDGLYAIVASGLRDELMRGRSLPFVQRYVAGTVFIGLGVIAAGASAGHTGRVKSS